MTRAGPRRPSRFWSVLGVGALAAIVVVVLVTRNESDANRSGPLLLVRGQPVRPAPDGSWPAVTGPVGMNVSTTLWTGDLMVLVGNADYRPGAATRTLTFSPRVGAWWQLPDPPVAEPLAALRAVWTGRQTIVVGVRCHRAKTIDPEDERVCSPGKIWAGAVDPRSGRWSRRPVPPVADGENPSVAGCCEAIGWDGRRAIFRINGQLFGLEGSHWVDLHDPGSGAQLCVSGSRLVSVVYASPGVPVSAIPVRTSALASDALDWTELPSFEAPGAFPGGVTMLCSPDSVVLSTKNLDHVWRLGPTSPWEELPPPDRSLVVETMSPPPVTPPTVSLPVLLSNAAWTGREFFWWMPQRRLGDQPNAGSFSGVGVALDPDSRSWRAARPGPDFFSNGRIPQLLWSNGVGYLGRPGPKVVVVGTTVTPIGS